MKKHQEGFAIFGLLIVLFILGLLIALSLESGDERQTGATAKQQAEQQLKKNQQGIENYQTRLNQEQ